MKYEVFRLDEGDESKVVLRLGTSKNVCFTLPITLEEIVLGVTTLIENVVGVATFELVNAVMEACLDDDEEEDGE